jgi:hypothetical protein
MATAITADDVGGWLGLRFWQSDTALTSVVAAVNAYVTTLPKVADLPEGTDWPDDFFLGAVMLGGRYYRRRNSPNGVEAITESGAQYVARYDSDISRMLGLDMYTKPAVG